MPRPTEFAIHNYSQFIGEVQFPQISFPRISTISEILILRIIHPDRLLTKDVQLPSLFLFFFPPTIFGASFDIDDNANCWRTRKRDIVYFGDNGVRTQASTAELPLAVYRRLRGVVGGAEHLREQHQERLRVSKAGWSKRACHWCWYW